MKETRKDGTLQHDCTPQSINQSLPDDRLAAQLYSYAPYNALLSVTPAVVRKYIREGDRVCVEVVEA